MQTFSAPSAVAAALRSSFQTTREATLKLCETLSAEDMMVQSTPEASPVKWHLAHVSWFFETFILREFVAGYAAFDPEYVWLFNSYYNSLGDMPEKKLRASFSRPSLARVLAYRQHVDAAVLTLLEQSVDAEVLRRVRMGLEHEQQHLELIVTDIKHALYTNPLKPTLRDDAWQPIATIAPPVEWATYAPGLTEIGETPDPQAAESFTWDNETPRHPVYLAPYALATRLVTCAEYLAFVDENGYRRPEMWLSEGWTTMRERRWEAPLYWQRDETTRSGWSIYTVHGMRSLDDLSETPVCHLSFFEADAFARWSGSRLPTEFEWEFAAAQGSDAMIEAGTLFETGDLQPVPAKAEHGLQQMFGDAWEWTQSPYTGYPGYRPLPGALGEYNGKFMSSQMVLRGGSCATPRAHIRASYRNFFGPATRWQISGLRLAKDVAAGASA
jgi:ergothioneine biosynthesis protein EgtB